MVMALVVALQFEKVRDLFQARTQLVQDYDGGHLGRFERHRIGFQMAMERPLWHRSDDVRQNLPRRRAQHLAQVADDLWVDRLHFLYPLVAWTFAMGFRYLLRTDPGSLI